MVMARINHFATGEEDPQKTLNVDVPYELVDLIRFLAAHHVDVLKFIHRECPRDIAQRAPSLQGAQNVFAAHIIAEQEYSAKNLNAAVKWLLENPDFGKK